MMNDKKYSYLLGLMWADGCVSANKRRNGEISGNYTAYIGTKDTQMAEMLRDEFDGRVAQVYSKRFDSYSYQVFLKRPLANRLFADGIIPNKSYNNPPVPMIPEGTEGHFVRGLFDGDGSCTKNKSRLPCIYLYGSETIMHWVSKILPVESRAFARKKATQNIWYLFYGKREDVVSIREWIYKDSGDLCLERKRALMNEANLDAISNRDGIKQRMSEVV